VRFDPTFSTSDLYLVHVDGGGLVQQLTNTPDRIEFEPAWSPDGTQIVFTVRDSSGWGHIRVVDTATKQVRELKSARTDAVFLTSRFIWYEGERACVAADVCGAQPPTHPLNDKTYIYDLETGTETESVITQVYDVWPHAA